MLGSPDIAVRYGEAAKVGLHTESSTRRLSEMRGGCRNRTTRRVVDGRACMGTVEQHICLLSCDGSRNFDDGLFGSRLRVRPKQIRTETQSETLARQQFEMRFWPVSGRNGGSRIRSVDWEYMSFSTGPEIAWGLEAHLLVEKAHSAVNGDSKGGGESGISQQQPLGGGLESLRRGGGDSEG
ncbi:hypothetical protein HID58_013431, partial [Brassica napus]